MRKLHGLIFVLTVVIPQQAIHASNPVPQAWVAQVNQVAEALVDEQGLDLLKDCLSEQATIRRFDRARPDSPVLLHLTTRNAVAISVRAYAQVPQTLAGDLSDDFANALGMPQSLRRPMLVSEGEHARRANLTAARWVGSLLDPRTNSATAVLVLWHPGGDSDKTNPPLLVLVRGQEISSGRWLIDQIIYGNLTQALRSDS